MVRSTDSQASLSSRYQGYLASYVYLAERHGVAKVAAFVGRVTADRVPAPVALREVFGYESGEDLAAAARRWRTLRKAVDAAFTLALLVLLVQAFRGGRVPLLAGLGLIAGFFCLYHVAAGSVSGGLGPQGAWVVRAVQGCLAVAGCALVFGGVRRLRRGPVSVPPANPGESGTDDGTARGSISGSDGRSGD